MDGLTVAFSRMFHWGRRGIQSPTAPAIALMAATALAFVWANSAFSESYTQLWDRSVRVGLGGVSLEKSLLHWINDGLMALFFLLVGLEVKRELLTGALSSVRKATLPVAAAIGGMVVPALVYTAVAGSVAPSGWGVPMATDIAFALGVLALLGGRVPGALVVFLMAFAVADDLGAVLVIALFYTPTIAVGPGLAAVALTLGLVALNRVGVRRVVPYLVVGALLWLAVYKSGVHATVAGILTAMAIPHGEDDDTPLLYLEHGLSRWVAWGVLPIFALANAGVALGGDVSAAHPVAIGIALGLVVGKAIGVTGASWLAVRLGWAELPAGVDWAHVVGLSLLGGIGFTMAIFVGNLAFADATLLDTAKAGILVGSIVAAGLGSLILWVTTSKR